MPVIKALIAGSCGGNVEALLKRVSAVHSSKGPFDVLFCVGQFFAKDGAWEGVASRLKSLCVGSNLPGERSQ